MAPAFSEGVSPSNKRPREANHPVAITCLQWDCDGALMDQDFEWLLHNLAAVDPSGVILVPWDSHEQPPILSEDGSPGTAAPLSRPGLKGRMGLLVWPPLRQRASLM